MIKDVIFKNIGILNIINVNMIRKLLKQAPKRSIILAPQTDPYILNTVIPNAYENLQQACTQFVQGIQVKDYEFLKSVMSPYLYSTFQSDFEKLKNNQINFKVKEHSSQSQFSVYAYVLFGGSIKRRLKNEEDFYRIGTNKFLRKKRPEEDIKSYLKSIKQKHIYGFQCLLKVKKSYEVEPCEENESEDKTNEHYFQINIETDSDQEDYYIMDVQGQVRTSQSQ